MALGWTQPLIEMSTRNSSWGGGGVKAAGADNLTTFMCRLSLEIWEPQPPVQACNGIALPLPMGKGKLSHSITICPTPC
jgi:hypothetical protein